MITAIVLIKTSVDRIPEIAESIAALDSVSEVFSVTGTYDLIAMVRVKAHDDLADVIPGMISKIPGVEGTDTHVAFRTYSQHDLEAAFAHWARQLVRFLRICVSGAGPLWLVAQFPAPLDGALPMRLAAAPNPEPSDEEFLIRAHPGSPVPGPQHRGHGFLSSDGGSRRCGGDSAGDRRYQLRPHRQSGVSEGAAQGRVGERVALDDAHVDLVGHAFDADSDARVTRSCRGLR